MSIALDILKEMYKKELNYRGCRCNIFGLPISFVHNKNSFRAVVNRIRRSSFITYEDEKWILTELGIKYIEKKIHSFEQFNSPFTKDSKKNLLLTFDIPESKKSGTRMVQVSSEEIQLYYRTKKCLGRPFPTTKRFS